MKRGFTLMEVNLAIMVMATGVLGMCCLYLFGYRESNQSVEDVVGVSCADVYLSPLVMGLSSREMTWSNWQQIGEPMDDAPATDGVLPAEGWRAYIDLENSGSSYRVKGNPSGQASDCFRKVMNKVPANRQSEPPKELADDYNYALVVTRSGARIQLAFRSSRRRDLLMAQPVTVVEMHFQGDPDK